MISKLRPDDRDKGKEEGQICVRQKEPPTLISCFRADLPIEEIKDGSRQSLRLLPGTKEEA